MATWVEVDRPCHEHLFKWLQTSYSITELYLAVEARPNDTMMDKMINKEIKKFIQNLEGRKEVRWRADDIEQKEMLLEMQL